MGNIEHLFLESDNFVLTIASGEVEDEKFLKHIAILNDSPQLSDGYRGIVDCRTVSPVKTPSSEAIFKAGHINETDPKNRKVAVLAANELIYGLVRMYDAYTAHAEMEVFDNLEDAVKWLGVESLKSQIDVFYESIKSASA